MPKIKNIVHNFNRFYLCLIGIVILLCLAVLLLWYSNVNSNQAVDAIVADVYFDGEYRIADGPWLKIVKGEHIPATKGDVTLRGNFHMVAPDGEYVGIYSGDIPIAFYINHISLTLYEGDREPFTMDLENPLYGASVCGAGWMAYLLTGDSEEPIEMVIHNPHIFGNETAIDDMLSNVSLWWGIGFEKGILDSGESQRNAGLLFLIVALTLLGIAVFSTLIHIKNNKLLYLFGLVTMFSGSYFMYSANGVSFWQDSVVSNTVILGSSMILYMFFVSMAIVCCLDSTKTVGMISVVCLGMVDGLLLVLPMVTDILFYDTWLYWILIQLIVNLVLIGSLVKECFRTKGNKNLLYINLILPLVAFGIDTAMTGLGIWTGGITSKYVFIVLFAEVIVVVLRIIPREINNAEKARDLELQRSLLQAEKNIVEAQLKESRVAIMLSQIQPHFIYNTLGTIERMCLKDPEKAFELVRNFAYTSG